MPTPSQTGLQPFNGLIGATDIEKHMQVRARARNARSVDGTRALASGGVASRRRLPERVSFSPFSFWAKDW